MRRDSDRPDLVSARGSRHRRRLFGIGAAILLMGVAGAVAVVVANGQGKRPSEPSPPPTQPVAEYFVSTSGHGNCAAVSPCATLDAAIAKASASRSARVVIEIADGEYPAQTVKAPKSKESGGGSIVVEPATGADVTLDSLEINAPRVTIRNLHVIGPVRLGTTAVDSGLDGVTTDGGTVLMAASGSFLRNSTVRPPVDSDGIQIKAYDGHNPDGVTVEHTTVGPTARGPKRVHVDCIQILGGRNITISYDKLFHCADEGIISGSGATGTVAGPIRVERTEIQLCPQRTSDCDGHDAISIAAPSVVFVHNTVIDGGTVFDVPDLTVAANYIENLKTCDGSIISNLVYKTNCANLASNNARGQLQFANPAAQPPDLVPQKAVVLPDSHEWVGGEYSSVDIDGKPVDPSAATVGAAEPSG